MHYIGHAEYDYCCEEEFANNECGWSDRVERKRTLARVMLKACQTRF